MCPDLQFFRNTSHWIRQIVFWLYYISLFLSTLEMVQCVFAIRCTNLCDLLLIGTQSRCAVANSLFLFDNHFELWACSSFTIIMTTSLTSITSPSIHTRWLSFSMLKISCDNNWQCHDHVANIVVNMWHMKFLLEIFCADNRRCIHSDSGTYHCYINRRHNTASKWRWHYNFSDWVCVLAKMKTQNSGTMTLKAVIRMLIISKYIEMKRMEWACCWLWHHWYYFCG